MLQWSWVVIPEILRVFQIRVIIPMVHITIVVLVLEVVVVLVVVLPRSGVRLMGASSASKYREQELCNGTGELTLMCRTSQH